jgi:hypothetical protein
MCETLISEGYCHRMLQNFVAAISCGRRAEEIIIGSHGEQSLQYTLNIEREELWLKNKGMLGRVLIL